MKYATIALLSTASALQLKNKLDVKAGTPAWDCSNSMFPNARAECWAQTAYKICGNDYKKSKWAKDAVLNAGGNNKEAYEMTQALKEQNCGKCDVSKAGCENSMWKDANKPDCWAAEAYQKCPNARQQAYDAVNQAAGKNKLNSYQNQGGGNTQFAYCLLQAIVNTDCDEKTINSFASSIEENVDIYESKQTVIQESIQIDDNSNNTAGNATASGYFIQPYDQWGYYNMFGEYCDYEYGCQSNNATQDEPEAYYDDNGEYCDADHGCSGKGSAATSKLHEHWANFLNFFDTDGSGTITLEEYQDYYAQMQGKQPTAEYQDAVKGYFSRMDVDQNGVITEEDYIAQDSGLAQVSKIMNKALKEAKKQQQ